MDSGSAAWLIMSMDVLNPEGIMANFGQLTSARRILVDWSREGFSEVLASDRVSSLQKLQQRQFVQYHLFRGICIGPGASWIFSSDVKQIG
jgi:hypothetical protein